MLQWTFNSKSYLVTINKVHLQVSTEAQKGQTPQTLIDINITHHV